MGDFKIVVQSEGCYNLMNPTERSIPVRLELREFVVERTATTPASMTRLIGSVNTIADRKALAADAALLLARVGRVDEFVGVHERGA